MSERIIPEGVITRNEGFIGIKRKVHNLVFNAGQQLVVTFAKETIRRASGEITGQDIVNYDIQGIPHAVQMHIEPHIDKEGGFSEGPSFTDFDTLRENIFLDPHQQAVTSIQYAAQTKLERWGISVEPYKPEPTSF